MITKIILKFFLIALFSVMLSACGLGKSQQSVDDQSSGEATNKKEPIEMVFYIQASGWTEELFMEQYGNAIKRTFPHIMPKFIPVGKGSMMEDLISSGQTIDIWMGSVNAILPFPVKYDLAYDISDLLKTHNYNLDKLEPTSIEQMRNLAGGGMYGLPYGTTTMLIKYNKDIFDKFGVPYPEDGITWDDLYEIAKKLTRSEGGIQYRGFSMTTGHIMLLNQLSAGFVDPKTEKTTLITNNWKQIAENFYRFYSIPGNEVTDKTVQLESQKRSFFQDKVSAMYITLSNLEEELKTMNWDAAQLPSFKTSPGVATQSYPNYALVTKQSKNKDDAFQVISFLTSSDMQKQFARQATIVPVVTKEVIQQFGQDVPMLSGKNRNAWFPAKMAQAPVKTKYDGLVQPMLYNEMYKYLAGMKDINTALRDASEAGQKAIDSEKMK